MNFSHFTVCLKVRNKKSINIISDSQPVNMSVIFIEVNTCTKMRNKEVSEQINKLLGQN